MEWMIMPLKRYADFSGRSRRKEYWMFNLGLVLATLVMVGLLARLGSFAGSSTAMTGGASILAAILGLGALAIVIPSLAVQVRRFHDQDKSGWFVLLGFIPYIGALIVFVFMCIGGTRGPNRFGPDPKGSGEALGEVFR